MSFWPASVTLKGKKKDSSILYTSPGKEADESESAFVRVREA